MVSEQQNETVRKIRDYQENSYEIKCILGVDGSPSCGVNVSPARKHGKVVLEKGKGIFIEILAEKLEKEKMNIPVIGIPETKETGNLEKTLERVEDVLRG